jgi:hypothetical protein
MPEGFHRQIFFTAFLSTDIIKSENIEIEMQILITEKQEFIKIHFQDD